LRNIAVVKREKLGNQELYSSKSQDDNDKTKMVLRIGGMSAINYRWRMGICI
jgi:hypothetical protein